MRSEDYAHLYALEESFWWFEGMRDITSALLDPVCLPARRRDILDAGCGTGGMLTWLERYTDGGRVAGVDISPTALDFCRERRHKYLAQASVTDLPFADSTFDLVTSFDVLVQVPGEGEDERAIREMYRVLRPGGVAFVRAAAYEWMRSGHDEALNTQRRYSLPLLKGRMERAGFRVTRATYANSLLRPDGGPGGTDRVTLTWAPGAIRGKWVQITVLPSVRTGLASADVFYFGNAAGE